MHSGQRFPIEESNLFILNELEQKEMERFKWIESEKAGIDVGWDRIKWMWWTTERAKWLRGIRESGMI